MAAKTSLRDRGLDTTRASLRAGRAEGGAPDCPCLGLAWTFFALLAEGSAIVPLGSAHGAEGDVLRAGR
eukprot:4874345-Alexandrium_andersonii.AAC.1